MYSKIKNLSEIKIVSVINFVFLLIVMLLIRFPVALGFRYNWMLRSIALPLIVAIIILNVLYIKKYKIVFSFHKWMLLFFALFLAFWIQAFIRTILKETGFPLLYDLLILTYIVVLCFYFFTIFVIFRNMEDRSVLVKMVLYGYSIYILANLVLHVLGVQPENTLYLAEYPTQMLSHLGFPSNRILFPMADGINNFGLLTGAVMVGLMNILRKKLGAWEKIFIFLLILVCFSVILLTDSRGGLLFSILAIAITFIPRKGLAVLKWIPFLGSTMPLLFSVFAPAFLAKYFGFLNRSSIGWDSRATSPTELACVESMKSSGNLLSNRTVIWSKVVGGLSNFQPIHLIGYGFRGQITSGISAQYACLFASHIDSLMATSHNIWLQLILDIGYLGLLITLIFLILTMIRLQHFLEGEHQEYFGLMGIVIYIIMIGSLEASVSPDFFEIFVLLIFIATLLVIPDDDSSKPIKSLPFMKSI